MKKIYHRTHVNKELLNVDDVTSGKIDLLEKLNGNVVDTLPKGKLIGIYFIDYIKEVASTDNSNTGGYATFAMPVASAFSVAHTNIRIEDTRGRVVTEPTDIQDYHRKNWNDKGYKEVELDLEANEQITIHYEVIGDAYPVCREFIFVIEDNSCVC